MANHLKGKYKLPNPSKKKNVEFDVDNPKFAMGLVDTVPEAWRRAGCLACQASELLFSHKQVGRTNQTEAS